MLGLLVSRRGVMKGEAWTYLEGVDIVWLAGRDGLGDSRLDAASGSMGRSVGGGFITAAFVQMSSAANKIEKLNDRISSTRPIPM